MENRSFMLCRWDAITMGSFSRGKCISGNLEEKAKNRQELKLQKIGFGTTRVRLGSMSM